MPQQGTETQKPPQSFHAAGDLRHSKPRITVRHALDGYADQTLLEGEPFDLRDLAELLPSGSIRVVREDNAYYLTAPEIDKLPEGTQFYKAAARLIAYTNGLGRAKNPGFRPLR